MHAGSPRENVWYRGSSMLIEREGERLNAHFVHWIRYLYLCYDSCLISCVSVFGGHFVVW